MIDAHCHLQDESFGDDFEAIFSESLSRGIQSFVVNGTSENDWEKVADLAREHPEIKPSFGLHPWYVSERSPEWRAQLEELLIEFPKAGVGEIGLDRWIKNHDIEEQLPVFEAQWKLAHSLDRPLSVHCLKAWGHLVESLNHLPEHRFLLHSYSGSEELVPVFSGKGAYFSISGYFLKAAKAEKLKVFSTVPTDRLLLETDSPSMELPGELDLHPDFEFNHPANLAVVYRQVAENEGIPLDALVERTRANFDRWFTGSAPKD
ncbi:MAG: TatD family hydrolase [Verrucomicrobiales bacterium]|nr:TatD family hydrolase [Verrucomicrobiales bacterium]